MKWKHQFQFAGYYAAVERGFYLEEGLKVTLVEGSVDKDPIESVLSGQAQFGVAGPELLLSRLNGRPLVALAAIFQHSPSVILSLKSSGIDSPHDLVGKRIMISEHGESDIWAMLLDEGIDTYRIIKADTTWDLNELIEGRIDATAAYLTNTPFFLLESGAPYNLIRPRTYGVDFYGDCLFTSEKELGNHPALVKKFRRASLKGWEYAMTHTDEMIGLIKEKYKSPKSKAHLAYESSAMEELILPNLVQTGHMNPGRWASMARTYVKLGMAQPGYNLDDFIYMVETPPDTAWVWWLVGGFSVTAGIMLSVAGWLILFNRKLKTAVEERTRDLQRESGERLHTEKTLRLTQFTVDHSGDGVFWIDSTGKFIKVNETACRKLDYTRDELEKLYLFDIDPKFTRTNWSGYWLDAKRKKYLRLESIHAAKAGHTFPVDININYLRFENLEFLCAFVRDITERKRFTQALEQLNDDLEKRVEQRTADLILAKEQSEAAFRARTAFLSNVSHELRTPLNAVIGLTDVVLDSDLAASQKETLQAVRDSAGKLLNMVNDIIELTGLEAGKTQTAQPFQLKAVVDSALREIEKEALGKHIEVSGQIDETIPSIIIGNFSHLASLLRVLLQNSVKFTEKGHISLEVINRSGSDRMVELHFKLSDSGIGIPDDKIDLLFRDLTQIDETMTRRYSGIGLGLTMARRLIELMNGRIWVESTEGVGTTFHFAINCPYFESPLDQSGS